MSTSAPSSSRRGVALVLFLIFLAIMASAALVLIGALLVTPGRPQTSVPSNATLFLRIEAPLGEVESLNLFTPLADQRPTLRQVVAAIDRAADDPRIRGMVVIPQTAGMMWAQLQEVRASLTAFRATGKSLVVYFEFGGAGEYYLASAAERVLMMPAGTLDVSGLATYELFFRGALDKVGVYPDLLHMGDFKTAANTFTERGFTPAHRDMSESLNRDLYDQLVRAIAAGRNRPEADIRTVLGGGPFLADEAVAAGLIDAVAYDDQIDDAPPVQGTRRFDAADYVRSTSLSGGTTRIALLYAVGTIASGRSSFDGVGGAVIGSDTFVEWIRKVRADSAIRAIVIRIDSPGGSAIASEVIWRELMLTRAIKPVVVSMGDVAASGGYYMAVPAHAIVAQPGTLTGSIGVVTGKYVLGGALDKLGIGTGVVAEGQNAQIYSPFRPFTTAERARVEEQMQTTYDLFVRRVADGRQSTPKDIDAIAQGRVWTGRQARELGLVDELGGLDRAVALAAERADLGPDARVQLVVYPPKRSFYDLVANPFGMTAMSLSTSLGVLGQRPEVQALESLAGPWARFRTGEALALMPNVFLPQR